MVIISELIKRLRLVSNKIWFAVSLRIQHQVLSKLAYLLLIFLLFSGGYYCFEKEQKELLLKYDYWGQKISAKNNINGVISHYQRGSATINNLWNHLQKKELSQKEEAAFWEKKKNTIFQQFNSSYNRFSSWVDSNKWPRLIKLTQELAPLVQTLDTKNYLEFETALMQKSLLMEQIVDKSTLETSLKAEIFIRLKELTNTFSDAKKILNTPTQETKNYNHLKNVFYDIYRENLTELIEIQNEKISFWNRSKKNFFYLILFFSFILAIQFSFTVYQSNRKKFIQFSHLNTSQMIIDSLIEMEDVCRFLSTKEMFDIDFKKDKTIASIKFTIGGIELDKKALHFEHTMKNGLKKSLFDLFSDLKKRNVKFNCCNYYKENDEPHSFTITLEVKTTK